MVRNRNAMGEKSSQSNAWLHSRVGGIPRTGPHSTLHHSSLLFVKMAVVYNIANAISSFFTSHTTATRQQCDAFASSLAGSPASPVPIQGTFSYTVTAGTENGKLFQFRVQESSLDMEIMSLARATHPQFVAGCKYHGTISQPRPLHVYEMDNLPGTPYIIARDPSVAQPPDAVLRQRNTVKGLARYVRVHIIIPLSF